MFWLLVPNTEINTSIWHGLLRTLSRWPIHRKETFYYHRSKTDHDQALFLYILYILSMSKCVYSPTLFDARIRSCLECASFPGAFWRAPAMTENWKNGTELWLRHLAVENYYIFDMEVKYVHENLFKTQEVKCDKWYVCEALYTLHLFTNIWHDARV